MEDKMFEHAQNMEFEDAARVRDEVKILREQFLAL